MAGDITKFDFSDNLRNNLGLQNVQPPINKVASFVQPVAEVVKFSNQSKSASSTATGTTTIYTTPSDKDFYIVSITASYVKDAASDCTQVFVRFLLNGAACTPIRWDLPTLTASNDIFVVNFPYPMRVDRNSAISLVGSFTVGTLTKFAIVTGIEI